MPILYFDSETFSECNLITQGTIRYAQDPTTEITVLQFAVDNDEPVVIDCTRMDAKDKLAIALLEQHFNNESMLIYAHNSFFDRNILKYVLNLDIPVHRWRDTMVQALCHGMPGSLDKICEALQLPVDESKDKRGKQLVMLFCKPMAKNSKLQRATRSSHPEQWTEFLEYSYQDIIAMRAIHRRLPAYNWTADIIESWHLDQTINDRGFYVDTVLATKALDAIAIEKLKLKKQVHDETFGEVESATQRDKLLSFILDAHGVSLPDMTADTLTRRIEDPELPEGVKILLKIRLEASRASNSKYTALLNTVNSDGRLRGTIQFSGASRTMRSAGRIFQPQNLPRPNMPQHLIDAGIESLKCNTAELFFPSVMRLTSNALRGCIAAAPGKKLVWADLSNIEGRKLVWLANEKWKLKAFADFDKGIGFDMYIASYSRAMNVDPAGIGKDSLERQIGKVMELALGYEGGVGAFLSFAAIYKLNLDVLAKAVWEIASMEELNNAMDVWEWAEGKGKTFGLDQRIYIANEVIKRRWRDAHPASTQLWKDATNGFRAAVGNPGVWVGINDKLRARLDGNWLRIQLPSGRYVCYLAPRVSDKGECSYMGVDPYTRRWKRIGTHGGKLVENLDQASSYDVLRCAMPRIEEAGYPIVLTVHDEVLTEVPDDAFYNPEDLAALLAAGEPWTKGLPLAAAGKESKRYHK